MSYSLKVHRVGHQGTPIDTLATFKPASEAEAMTLVKSELLKTPRATSPVMFSLYDDSSRMILSYTSEASAQPD